MATSLNYRTGAFTTTGAPSTPDLFFQAYRDFNLTISGTFTGTVYLQRSFDAGVTWHNVSKDASGTPASFTTPVSLVVSEPENGVYYRLNCTACTGQINWRFSQ